MTSLKDVSSQNFISLETNQFKLEYRDSGPAEYETDVLKKTSITNANILRGTTMPSGPLNWNQLATFCKTTHLFDVKGQNTGSQKGRFFENPIRD